MADIEHLSGPLEHEIARQESVWADPVSRRHFLKLLGASMALAGLTGCGGTKGPATLVPYVHQPAEMVPGKSLYYTTAMVLGGYATGLLAESHLGRPTKIEGNPSHPASLGGTDVFAQASVLELYDPDRSQTVTSLGRIRTRNDFLQAFNQALATQRVAQGSGVHILTETITSPTLGQQLQAILSDLPQAKWHQWEPLGRDNARAGARLAFGQNAEAHYQLDRADVILALDADFLMDGPGRLRYARDFAARRRAQAPMNRLYAVESTMTVTGSMADHRLPLRSSDVEAFTRAVAAGLGLQVGTVPLPPGLPPGWIEALVRDLQAHRGTSLVVPGEWQPPVVHALAHAMNQSLGNAGATVVYTDPVEANPTDQMASLRDLVADLAAGRVQILLMLGGNPAFTAPADLQFADNLAKAAMVVHLGLFSDETTERSTWHIPQAHYLEAWSDARAYDGTVSIIQPLIEPLYTGLSAHELLAAFTNQPQQPGHDIVQGYWKTRQTGGDFDTFWRTSLHDGVVASSTAAPKTVSLQGIATWGAAPPSPPAASPGSLEIVFRPDPSLYDGRFANNGWLQELPKPFTKIAWDNAALVSPATAARLGLNENDVVELSYQGRTVRAPAWIMPGHADDSVTVHLGYGMSAGRGVAQGHGFNAYALRISDQPWFGTGLQLQKTGEQHILASTRNTWTMEGRDLARVADIQEYQRNPNVINEPGARTPPGELFPPYPYPGYAWGMSIDISACIGCNACIVACQAENNIPVVGRDQVLNQRNMQWLRVDRYYAGDLSNPTTLHQPVPCMQCENAPCELVCPPGATSHSDEGLNDMVYNRCIGTRYCSNNCPYKVRRFNFLLYADWNSPSLKPLRNPNVTVRSRGVMEKCTYCVQRIEGARSTAEKEGRPIRDGEILTACQAACPTQAIVFGNINDPTAQVVKLKQEPRNYALLAELNTRPRTTYLAGLKNPNPDIKTG